VLADDIPYTPAEYVGTYVLRALDGEPVASIVISEQDGALVAQADGQPLLTLRPTAPDSFGVYFGDIDAGISIDFVRDENGRVAYVSVGYRIGVREG
jgi:hypothetical protein